MPSFCNVPAPILTLSFTASSRVLTLIFCHPTLHRFSSSSSNRSARWGGLLYPVLHLPLTSVPDDYLNAFTLFTVPSCKWICPRKIDLPPTDLATYQYLIASYGSLWQHCASNNHCVRFMIGHARQNTKSTYRREGLTSHFTRTTENRRMCVQSCHARKARSRHASSHQAVGIACRAIQITLLLHNLADYNDYLISKLCV